MYNNISIEGKVFEILKKDGIKMKRFTGGFNGYRAACLDMETINRVHNPVIRYSDSIGFYACSGNETLEADEHTVAGCYYNLNNGGKYQPNGTRSEYDNFRSEFSAKYL